MITIKKTKSFKQTTHEWDLIAAYRERQVRSQKDHSANCILSPAILNEINDVTSIIDIGCGTGWLTVRAAKKSTYTVGVDPSEKSIDIAKSMNSGSSISYVPSTIEQYSITEKTFDVAISNMAASCSPDLVGFITASRRVLKKNGLFVFTVPHPCFWPEYWGYSSDPHYKYDETFAVEGEFKIQNESSSFLTTHFHHPIEHYIKTITFSGFIIESIRELTGRGFRLPRFMLIVARAV